MPDYKINGIPVRVVMDSTLPAHRRACVECCLYSHPACGRAQAQAGFSNCAAGDHHYKVVH